MCGGLRLLCGESLDAVSRAVGTTSRFRLALHRCPGAKGEGTAMCPVAYALDARIAPPVFLDTD